MFYTSAPSSKLVLQLSMVKHNLISVFDSTLGNSCSNGLHTVKASDIPPFPTVSAFSSSSNSSNCTKADTLLNYWHKRLGHLNITDILRLQCSGCLGFGKELSAPLNEITRTDVILFQCDSCIRGKTGRLPSSLKLHRAQSPLDLVHLWT